MKIFYILSIFFILLNYAASGEDRLPRVQYNNSGLVIDWDSDGISELLVRAEDGLLYHMGNPDRVSSGRKYKGAGHAK